MTMPTDPIEQQLRADAAAWHMQPSSRLRAATLEELRRCPTPSARPALLRPLPLLLAAAAALALLMVAGGLASQSYRQSLASTLPPEVVKQAHMPASALAPAGPWTVPSLLPESGPVNGLASVMVVVNQQVDGLPATMSSFADTTYASEWDALKQDMLAMSDSLTSTVPLGLFAARAE